jgi:hypothetical protein
VRLQATDIFMEAEEEAVRVSERYSPAAAESISYGTFMQVHLQQLGSQSDGLQVR